jgi:hypothetical protein
LPFYQKNQTPSINKRALHGTFYKLSLASIEAVMVVTFAQPFFLIPKNSDDKKYKVLIQF